MADDRIKLVAEQVERVYNASYAQRSSNPNPRHTSNAAMTMAPLDVARPLLQPRSRLSSAATTTLHSPSNRHPYKRSVFVMSRGRCHGLVRVRHREPPQLYNHLEYTPLRSLDVCQLAKVRR